MAKRSRDKMITFWVTEDELAKINANMEKLGTSNLSAYLRKMAITGLIIRLDIPELKQIVSLMRRTSANINQMANISSISTERTQSRSFPAGYFHPAQN